jgi:hypothetical protein
MLVETLIPVSVIADRKKAESRWIDFIWVPKAVMTGLPETAPMTSIATGTEGESFFVGATNIVLASTETANYRDNLLTGSPKLWVVLRASDYDTSVELVTVTADPAEGEAHTEAGSNIVDALPMPAEIAASLAAFVDEHHVEREFFKRRRDRKNLEAMGRRMPGGGDDS